MTGWEKSKAASNEDGGISDLIAFLERRSTMNMAKWATSRGSSSRSPVKIKKVSISHSHRASKWISRKMQLHGYTITPI